MKMNIGREYRERLQAGKKVFSVAMGPGNDPQKTVRIVKEFGADSIMLDNEHSLLGKETIYQYIRACRENELPILMRAEEKTSNFRSYLDSGINAMMLPRVNTVEEAAYGVRESYFPPTGHRGAGIGMSPYLLDGQQPSKMHLLQMLQYVNENTMLFPMTESLEGLSNLPGILELEGVTGTLVGAHDLTIDIAFKTGRINPDSFRGDLLNSGVVQETLRKIAEICKRAGKVCGVGGFSPKGCAELAKLGYQYFGLGYVTNGDVESLRPVLEEAKALIK